MPMTMPTARVVCLVSIGLETHIRKYTCDVAGTDDHVTKSVWSPPDDSKDDADDTCSQHA